MILENIVMVVVVIGLGCVFDIGLRSRLEWEKNNFRF